MTGYVNHEIIKKIQGCTLSKESGGFYLHYEGQRERVLTGFQKFLGNTEDYWSLGAPISHALLKGNPGQTPP